VLFNEPKLLKYAERNVVRQAIPVSVLFNEPKLLKSYWTRNGVASAGGFSALQRAEIAEIAGAISALGGHYEVSVLFNEPKLLKSVVRAYHALDDAAVSVLFNEPKLLKSKRTGGSGIFSGISFSALQRAEIAEISGYRSSTEH